MSKQPDIVGRLRNIAPDSGWAVVNKETEGIVIWFSRWKSFRARDEALKFMGEHPHYAETHEVREYTSPCLDHEAADEIERLHSLNAELVEALQECLADLEYLASASDSDYARPDPGTLVQARAALKKATEAALAQPQAAQPINPQPNGGYPGCDFCTCPPDYCHQNATPPTERQAAQPAAILPLSEDLIAATIVSALAKANVGDETWRALTFETGPYDITKPRAAVMLVARAIEAAVHRKLATPPTEPAPQAEPAETFRKMPNPTPMDLVDPLFEAIWSVAKTWDVNAPEYYNGYCGLNGSHVMLILESVRKALAAEPAAVGELPPLPERERFEAWIVSNGGSVDWTGAGEYRSAVTECAWSAWQARAALAAAPQVREPLTDHQLWANDDLMAINAEAGFKMQDIIKIARAVERAHGIGA